MSSDLEDDDEIFYGGGKAVSEEENEKEPVPEQPARSDPSAVYDVFAPPHELPSLPLFFLRAHEVQIREGNTQFFHGFAFKGKALFPQQLNKRADRIFG